MKTDSGLSAYCHGNADFPNVWERCWPTTTIPIYKGPYRPFVMSTTVLKGGLGTGDLCDYIGLVAVAVNWCYMYVIASPSHHDQAIPLLSPLHVGHPHILFLKFECI